MARQFDVPGLKALGLNPSDFATQASLFQTASVTLNNDQIIHLPSSSVVLVPATEVTNYTELPTKLFVPVFATGVWDSSAGAYTIDNATHLALSFGSPVGDFVVGVAGGIQNYAAGSLAFLPINFGDVDARKMVFQFVCSYCSGLFLPGDFIHDNSLTVFLNNSGDLTDGNSANTLKITVYYVTVILG